MKKKKGLAVWTILTIVFVVVLVLGFAFSSVTPVVGLYSKGIANAELGTLALGKLYQPFVYGYETFFVEKFAWDWTTGLTVGIVGLFVVSLIAMIVAMAIKKQGKYWGHIVLALVVTVIGLYSVWYVLDPSVTGGLTIARQMVTKGSDYQGALLFGAIPSAGVKNVVFSIALYVFIIGCLLSLVSMIMTVLMVLCRCAQAPKVEKVKVVEPKDETVVPTVTEEAPVVEDETKEVPVAPKKKKVVLVVKRYDAFKDPREPVIQRETTYPKEKIEVKPLTREDIRAVLREELDAREAKERKERHEVNFNNETVHAEVSTPKKEAVSVSVADVTKEVKEAPQIPTPVIIAIPEPVKEEDVAKEPKVKTPKEPTLNKDQVRDIIRDELAKALEVIKNQEPEVEEEVIEEKRDVPVKVIEKIIEKRVEVPVEKIVEKPVEVIKEVPVEKIVEVVKEKPAEKEEVKPEVAPEEEKAEAPAKIIRIPFTTRILEADDQMKDNYNHIKALLMSYGLKNRVSNGGDAFRLHKVTYCKITVAGKSLKLYLALDPNDYKNSTLPIKDSSSKEMYKDIPLVFKVKSGLSLRRAEELIQQMMDKHGIEQADRVQVKDYVAALAQETPSDDEDISEDED